VLLCPPQLGDVRGGFFIGLIGHGLAVRRHLSHARRARLGPVTPAKLCTSTWQRSGPCIDRQLAPLGAPPYSALRRERRSTAPAAPELLEVTLDELQRYFPPGWSALEPFGH
jgi:hypothetical protein